MNTLNVGTSTGRDRDIVGIWKRRRVNILYVQETKWKGAKAQLLGEGYKLYYGGQIANRNGVGIILDPSLTNAVIEVERASDRFRAMKMEIWELFCMV